MEPHLPELSKLYRVFRYDTRGHGDTDAPAGAYTLEQLADDAHDLLEALGITRTHWIGLSLGGMIGHMLALETPELITSLCLCDTSSLVPAEARTIWTDRIKTVMTHGMEQLVEPTIARWFTSGFVASQKDVVDSVRAMIRRTLPVGYAGCCHAISMLDLTDRISAIPRPTLIVVGEEDQGTPVAASRTINERIKGSELIIIKSASHLSNVERPQKFTTALLDFLNKVA